MKKNYFVAILALIFNFASAQIEQTTYRGAFAPAPTAQWTDSWTNFDPNNAAYGTVTNVISADITANTTWTADKVYELNGTIYVRNNATLTIQPGTVIRSNVAASALFVTRGAKLNAIGTASQPIVFTSKNAVGARNRGDWGGIVLLGRGAYNVNNGENYIEGISQTVETQFGGGLSPINNDNSGTLKYVRIEFAGYVFSPNNELNGLTMGACGSGTTIDYVQVSYSNDDSFEWFGGSVNCKHLVALNGLDDDFDTDNGYNGIVQFALSVRDPLAADISTSECFESDNNSGGTSVAPFTSAIFTNVTAVGPTYRSTLTGGSPLNGLYDRALRIRRASKLKVFNSLFLDFKRGLHLDGTSSENFAVINDELKFENNIIASAFTPSVPLVNTAAATIAWYAANNNTSLTSSAGILTLPYNATAQNYTGLDHRPGSGSIAETGATFTDAAFTGLLTQVDTPNPIVTTPINYCRGVVAAPLNVVNAPGTILQWYTAATGGTASAVTPTVLTTVVGTKIYYVTQKNTTTGVESSPRTAITVNTLASPTVALGTITNGDLLPAISAIGQYVGTTTPITYTVPASSEAGVTAYFWTVPLGTTIVSGQGTNSLTVHFNNVPAGAETYGNIGVQAENANGCRGTAKTLSLSKAFPIAPASVKMTDALLPNSPVTGLPVPVTSFAEYMGTSKELTITAAPVSTASSYVWELPTGVNPILGTAGTPVVKLYATYPFTNTISSAPTANGNVYYRVTETVYSNGITIQTATKTTVGGAANVVVTNLTNEGATINPAFPIVSSTSNVIYVNFLGVTSANTYNYTTVAAVPVSTNVLRIGAKSRNGVGVSVTNNAAVVDPTTTSTAKLLTLKAVLPKAPTLKMTNDAVSTTTAVTVISKFIGTTTEFTLTSSVAKGASSYEWLLPAGVNVTFGNPATDRIIKVNFANVAPGITTLYIGARSKNGIGTSDSSASNGLALAPYTNSPYKLLKLTAAVPSAVTVVTGQVAALCGNSTYNYTMTASVYANSYVITAPTGSVVTSATVPGNTTNVLSTSDLTFSVTYPSVFAITTATPVAEKSLVITSVNGVGNSLVNKIVTLATALGKITTVANSYVDPVTSIPSATKFGKCTPQTFTITPVPFATSYVWTLSNGAVAVGDATSNSIVVDFSGVTGTTNVIAVKAFNGCTYSAEKSVTLTWDTRTCDIGRMNVSGGTPTTVSIYPNPAVDNFTVELNSSEAGSMTMTIYNMNGSQVSTKDLKLTEGNNVINENISSLSSGIYFVNFYNSTNNETIVKKLVKN
ncbi:T9SS type A sorting domain-containing protein [Flavobacterium sp.]|uniref:T9SS type A sorting domain-containing protein n=1 Tax=Flavobacterium sp. TaxID=239 RepID=UPI0039189B72